MSAAPPPLSLYQSGWHPFISAFVHRVNVLAQWTRPGRGELHLVSWYRSPGVNRDAGGSPESQHLLGLAADIGGAETTKRRLLALAPQAGLIGVRSGSSVHLQLFPAGALARAGVSFPV